MSLLAPSQPQKPNILVMLVDDMGFSDIGCYGGEVPTPNLDALAKNGVRFTQFYNTARCCPTRAALLTGLYPHQAGVGHMMEDKGYPGYSGRLNDRCVTMAEVLNTAGYYTSMTGKWHVGHAAGVLPSNRGFRRSLHSPVGGHYFAQDKGARIFLDGKLTNDLPPNWYSTDLWTEYALKFIDEARAQNKPFFHYLAFNAPHFPLQAPAEDIARFRGKYRKGWDAMRADRLARQKALGLAGKGWDLSTRPEEIPAWDSLSDAEKDRFDHLMAVYVACLSRVDRAIGNLVAALKQRGELDNTLILFMSDNGGNAESGPNGRTEGDPSRPGSTWFCGKSWAWLENTPFREYKHWVHEGGISTPLIAHWPKGIPRGRNGSLEPQPAHLIDIMATVVDVGNATYPTGGKIKPKQGVTLRPAFAGKPLRRPTPIFWEHEGNRAVRDGRWKLVAKENGPWELYDIETNRSEVPSRTVNDPGRIKAMAAAWDAYAARCDVLPLGGWRGKPSRRAGAAGSKANQFTLNSGDALQGGNAPAIANRPFTVTARFDSTAETTGVIVAQGGLQQGYTLFVKEGKLSFALRANGQISEVSLPITAGMHTATATLTAQNELRLQLDAATATGTAKGKIANQPVDGLEVGRDEKGVVGAYQGPYPFTNGTIRSVELSLGGG